MGSTTGRFTARELNVCRLVRKRFSSSPDTPRGVHFSLPQSLPLRNFVSRRDEQCEAFRAGLLRSPWTWAWLHNPRWIAPVAHIHIVTFLFSATLGALVHVSIGCPILRLWSVLVQMLPAVGRGRPLRTRCPTAPSVRILFYPVRVFKLFIAGRRTLAVISLALRASMGDAPLGRQRSPR